MILNHEELKQTTQKIISIAKETFEANPDVTEIAVEQNGIKVTFKRKSEEEED